VKRGLKENKANGEKDTKDHIDKAKSELKEVLMHSNDKIERKIQLKLEELNTTITQKDGKMMRQVEETWRFYI